MILVGFVIVIGVIQTKQVMSELDENIDMEQMNTPQAIDSVEKPLDSLVERVLKTKIEEDTRVTVTKEVLREKAKASGEILGGGKSSEDEKTSSQDQPTSSAPDDRLNIVLFYADDWTMNVLGKIDSNAKTPNIDKMAEKGMLFRKNCVTTSVCWISRATLMTGTYSSRHRHNLPFIDKMFETHNWKETLFPKLKSAGYYTGLIGKWHGLETQPYIDDAFDKRNIYYGRHWEERDGVKRHVTDLNRWDAIEFLKNRPKDNNFALKVSFFATHAEDGNIPSYKPMNWTRMGIYPDNVTEDFYQTFVPAKTATEKHWKDLPLFLGDDLNCGRIRWKERWEPHCWQKNIRDLYAMATEVDWAIGEIIGELKKQGVYDNTLLVFTTDNGDLHGEHGLAEKWFPFEESIHVPLVIQDPRMPAKYHGSVNEDWTLNVDLAPTLLGAAGLGPASFMQGRDIAQLYLANETKTTETTTRWKNNILRYDTEEARKPWREEWFYEWNMGDPVNASGHMQNGFIDAAFALVTNEWKYIFWPQKPYEQLFHRSVDKYDEYDILQNYHLFNHMLWVDERVRRRMENFTQQTTTPYGDSIESTKEIYETMKAKYEALKKHVQEGGKI